MSVDQRNLYEVIGLPGDASQDLIEERCIRLGELYQPEKNVGDIRAAIVFAQVEKAYETLGDPVRRAAYDAELLGQSAKPTERKSADAIAVKNHQMKDSQKLLCIGIIAVILAMCVYPPFQVHWQGRISRVGYGWIFSPPLDGAATIDVAMLIVQWVIVLGIGAIAYILLRKSSQELLSDPPTGPTLPQAGPSPIVHSGFGQKVLGTKWLKYWNYFILPGGGILCIVLLFDFRGQYVFLLFWLSYLHFCLAYGLYRRKLWAWEMNWVMIVATWIGGPIPDVFGSGVDFWVKYFIGFLVYGVFWMWPNYVYWKKRRVLFQESAVSGERQC